LRNGAAYSIEPEVRLPGGKHRDYKSFIDHFGMPILYLRAAPLFAIGRNTADRTSFNCR
jgi:hypothetical protein